MKKLRYRFSPILFVCALGANAGELDTEQQKGSYAIGLQLGSALKQQGVDVDIEAFSLAVEDTLAGKDSRLTPEEITAALEAQKKKVSEKMDAVADENLKKGQQFLAENKKDKAVKETASGLQYKVLNEGAGKSPKVTDKVTVHYKGTLIDGTEFDSSYKRGEPATFPVNGVVKGWQEALPMMKEGDKWQIFLPTDLAYGKRGAGGAIGPNEALIFDIELVSINKE